MAKTNTEKPTGKAETKKAGIVETPKKKEKINVPLDKTPDKKVQAKKEEKKNKKPVSTKPKIKKDFAVVNVTSLPISTKHSIAICKFVKGKKIPKAISDLEEVVQKRKAVPMKGELPHRKGNMMSGRYPEKAAKHFIKLLKSLSANSNVNELNNPVISEAIANLASRPFGRFGRVRKKRTSVRLKAVEKKFKTKKGEKK